LAVSAAACGGGAGVAGDVVDAVDTVDDHDVVDVAVLVDARDAVAADAVADGEAVDAVDASAPLGDGDGLAVWLSGLAAPEGLDGVWLEVAFAGDRFPVGAESASPPLWQVPPPELGPPELARVATWSLAAGQPTSLEGDAWLLARAPEVRTLDLTVFAWERHPDGGDTLVAEAAVSVRAGEGAAVRQVMPAGSPLAVWIRARAGVPRLPPSMAVGMVLDGSRPGLRDTVDAFAADLGGRRFWFKAYQGARRWLLRPGCASDVQCAIDGENYPCVSECACHCDAQDCDCDFSGLEAHMRAQALGAARRVFGADASPEVLAAARVHYVFKRSLGGTTSCEVNGEVDVDPATYAAFFRAALEAAHRVNVELGFPLIAAVSPQNESNHPLQDGPHRNAAGMRALGGDGIGLPYVDIIARQSCDDTGACCAKDRYLVEDPDSVALLAAALVAGRVWHAAALVGPDAALAPEVAVSVYLDSDQVDPLAVDDAGEHPAVVTPAPRFFEQLAAALDATPGGSSAPADWASDLVFVDTYPGSWGEPWFVTDDEVVHHYDPVSRVAMRYEAVAAADRVTERARAAIDAFEARFATRPRYILGETGWATIDRDDAAQARFVRRVFARAGELAEADPAFGGFIWFKDTDRLPPSYPRWVDGADPITGDVLPCDTWFLSRVACAADVLVQMEGQWGLFWLDGDAARPKPAWEAWRAAFLAWVPAP
jgi:hypothetical protein